MKLTNLIHQLREEFDAANKRILDLERSDAGALHTRGIIGERMSRSPLRHRGLFVVDMPASRQRSGNF
jgi:hypothetical protein